MKVYLVGGAVRDKLLGLPVKERDYVVVGATPEDMLKLGYRQVGKEFPVFLHPATNEEYALARMERKVGLGYKGFTFDASPTVSLEEDLIRRDLTINAMAESTDGELIDPYHGREDLNHKILRHVSPAFAEDPVRILRVGRFYARYAYLGFHLAPETVALMSKMVQAGEVNALVAERVWKELERALGEKNPEKFFEILNDCAALPILFPDLDINGAGIKALKAATKLNTNNMIRFAALMHAHPENASVNDAKKSVALICNRYRVPNAYQALATLTALNYHKALNANTFNADELLQLFSTLDIFRREDRFRDFVTAIQAIANAAHITFDAAWLLDAATVAKSYDVQTLLAQGLDGQALATALKEKRSETLSAWLQQ